MKQFSDLTAQDKAGFVEVADFNGATQLARSNTLGNSALFYSFAPNNQGTDGRTMKAVAVLLLHVFGCTAQTYRGPVLWKRRQTVPQASVTMTGWTLCGRAWGNNTSAGAGNQSVYQINEIVYRDAAGNARFFRTTATVPQSGPGNSYNTYSEQTSDTRFYTQQAATTGGGGGLPPEILAMIALEMRKRDKQRRS